MTEIRRGSGSRSGFSRRAFLKGSSAVAAATALHQQTADAAESLRRPVVVRDAQEITLNVNGSDRKVNVEPRDTLLETLRYQLNLTGAKPVSLEGSSGASTVLIDDKPAMASTTLSIACQGKKVVTVESVSENQPDSVARAFLAHDAQQCGFCTPGFVVAVRAFLKKNPRATEQQIREGLNGNICRCGTYANIVQAAMAVVKGGGNG